MVSPPLGDCDHLEPFPLATPLPVPLLGPRRRRYLRQCAVLLANHLLVILADTVECMPSCHPIIICCSIYLLSRRITTLTISNWGPFGGGGNHPGPQFCRAQDARRTRGSVCVRGSCSGQWRINSCGISRGAVPALVAGRLPGSISVVMCGLTHVDGSCTSWPPSMG